MNKKGQIAVEFMLLIVVILLYLQGVVQPNLLLASQALEDTVRVGQTRLSAEKLVNAINFVSASTGESKQTINLYIPKKAKIMCKEDPTNTIGFEAIIEGTVEKCPPINGKNTCSGEISVLEGTNLECGNGTNSIGSELTSEFIELAIYKDTSGVVHIEQ